MCFFVDRPGKTKQGGQCLALQEQTRKTLARHFNDSPVDRLGINFQLHVFHLFTLSWIKCRINYQYYFTPLNIVGATGPVAPTKNYFVFAMTAANACGSRIARSDNILRLSSMFAFFSAATSLL